MRNIDFTKFTKDGKDTTDPAKTDKRWWLVEKENRASAVANVVLTLIRYDDIRQSQLKLNAKLYGNVDMISINSLTRTGPGSGKALEAPVNRGRSQFNIVQSGIDTLVSKQAKNKPKPLFLTSGGDWKTQRKAKKLDKFVDGIFYENDVYSLNNEIRRDAYVFGDGLVQVFPLNGRVKFERVMSADLLVDWVEALSGDPRQLHRVKNIDRDVLCDLFPKSEAAIRGARSISSELAGTYQNVADQLTVVESWHLQSGPKAGDGCHTINILSVTGENTLTGINLSDDMSWQKERFPFAQRRWNKRLKGHWSQGIPEQIEGTQLELNKLLWMISRSYHMAGTFKIWIKTGSKIPKGHINNDIGTVIVGDQEPKYLLCPPVTPEHMQRVKDLRADGFEQIGISQLSAVSQKPAGLDSGKALRTYNDIESERFMADGQEEERYVLELGRLAIDCAIDLYRDQKKYTVKAPGRKFVDTIDWKDIDIDADSFIMKMFPVSSLPQDPAGRLQTIQEYIQSGMLDPVTGRRLLETPDLEQHETLANAQEDWINQVLEDIVDNGKYVGPEPEMDLKLAKWFCLMYIAQGHVIGIPGERLDLLRQWSTQLDDLAQKALPPPPPMPLPNQPGGGAPQAAPMAPPQSDLIQNVPAMAGA